MIDALLEVGDEGAIAVEVSSFQLTGIREFHPRVAVLLNVAEDHTDWHGSFEHYVAAKARIALNQTAEDVFVTNRDDAAAMSIAEGVQLRGSFHSPEHRCPRKASGGTASVFCGVTARCWMLAT